MYLAVILQLLQFNTFVLISDWLVYVIFVIIFLDDNLKYNGESVNAYYYECKFVLNTFENELSFDLVRRKINFF